MLQCRVNSGLWHLTTNWKQGDGISAAIWSQVEAETKDRDNLVIRSGKRDRTIKLTPEWRRKLRTEVFSTMSFIMAFLDQMLRQDEQRPDDGSRFGPEHEITQLVLDIIDISAIRADYAEAIDLFRQQIWHPDFVPGVAPGEASRLRTGTFFLQQGPRQSERIAAIAWTKEPLQSLVQLLTLLGKISEVSLIPVFSPEEEVFEPYFELLGMAYEYAVPQRHLQPLVAKAIANFAEENYTDCVSALGLAAEDVLTQIYETFYREQLTKGLTLGQLADEIHARAIAKFKKRDEPPPDVTVLFSDIREALALEALPPTRSLELLRKLVVLVQESNKHTNGRLDKFGRPEHRNLLWTDQVNHAVNELIRYRNAASHKSRVPIGPMECRRAAYGFIVLFRWWLKERGLIDWSRTPDEILKDSLERHAKQ